MASAWLWVRSSASIVDTPSFGSDLRQAGRIVLPASTMTVVVGALLPAPSAVKRTRTETLERAFLDIGFVCASMHTDFPSALRYKCFAGHSPANMWFIMGTPVETPDPRMHTSK